MSPSEFMGRRPLYSEQIALREHTQRLLDREREYTQTLQVEMVKVIVKAIYNTARGR